VLYYGVGGVLALVLLAVGWQTFFSNRPTCFDGILNQGEQQVDCGGLCARICPLDARAPVVLWNRPFQTGATTYTAVAYVENRNVGALARDVRYTFRLYDARGVLVVERLGSATLAPAPLVPIVETGIDAGNREVVTSEFRFADDEVVWERNLEELPVLRATEQNLTTDGSRLTSTIVNNSILEARNVEVVAVLFDALGVARAASKSVLPRIARQSSEAVIFTWPNGVPGVVRAEISTLPSL
jgi:hypothetical protein